ASVSTIAGAFHERGAVDGTGSQVRFEYAQGMVGAPDGTLYVADTGNDMIRKVTVSGGSATVVTIAGVNHHARWRDGVGTAARFNNPEGLAITSDGKTLYIADSRNNRIREDGSHDQRCEPPLPVVPFPDPMTESERLPASMLPRPWPFHRMARLFMFPIPATT
ncbi:MAG: NHL repeat containing protein, partial [Leptospirillum sp. Group IV 'UBA BS']